MFHFLGVLAPKSNVGIDLTLIAQTHAPLDPTREHRSAIIAEIKMGGARTRARIWPTWTKPLGSSAKVLVTLR